MMRQALSLILLLVPITFLQGQVVSWEPEFPTENDSIVVYFHADQGNQALQGYSGTVYAHTGLISNMSEATTGNPGGWVYEIQDFWGQNRPKLALERIATDEYRFIISPSLYHFYLTSEGKSLLDGEVIEQIAFVFRNSDGSVAAKTEDEGDIFLPVFQPGITAVINSPALGGETSGDVHFPVMMNTDEQLMVEASSAALGTETSSLTLHMDGETLLSVDSSRIMYSIDGGQFTPGMYTLSVIAEDTSGLADTSGFHLVISGEPEIADLPAGVIEGITYNGASSVTLVLYAPDKEHAYIIGDFNDWQPDQDFFMKKTPDSAYYWLEVSGLSSGQEYAYQYLVDGSIRIADPYTEKVLDPWNDPYIEESVYPGLKDYPDNKTMHPVSVLQTNQSAYEWQNTDYTRPDYKDLVIYELLVRDFVEDHNYQTLIDTLGYFKRLGINAIELMPVNEFEGNISWGYNPSFYFAPDKYYGTKNDLKAFIDACHGHGFAVIIDMVLNHSFGQSPFVRLYWDPQNEVYPSYIADQYQHYGTPAANSPWYNQRPTHPYNVGYDFNHENEATQKLVDRVNTFWLEEYNIDGFRFDLTKGFTNKVTVEYYVENGQVKERDTGAGARDDSRINILTRMYNTIRETDETAYVILEHFADNSEETVLVNQGMLVWGNLNYNYNEATMGWHKDNSIYGKSDFSWGYYGTRGWSQPNVVTYMESHDEERLMYKNLQYGNSSGDYNVKDPETALERIKLAAAFFFTYPGPKMIWQFGELGYDYSINENGRTGPKPIRWDYLENENRERLFKTFSALIHLRNENEVFRDPATNVSLDLLKEVKRIKLTHSDMNVVIIGNFDVVSRNADPKFHTTGRWYDFFSGDSMEVSDVNEAISLAPGVFHIYTDMRLETPEAGLVTDVENSGKPDIHKPLDFSLEQNYPNPFNPETQIVFTLPSVLHVSLEIYNISGQRIRTLVEDTKPAGRHEVVWNGRDDSGSRVASGIYVYKLSTDSFSDRKKMILIK